MKGALHRFYTGETNIDFIGKRRWWFAISGVMVAISLISLFTRGLNFGIEFEGGLSIQSPIPADGPLGDASSADVVSEIRDRVDEAGGGAAQIQVAEGDDGRFVIVQSELADPETRDRIKDAVIEAVGATSAQTDVQQIGEQWGGEITEKAIRALIIFFLVVLAFISIRFEWKMALAGLLALIHDLVITAGVYSLVGFEVSPSTVIAILTILGYSLYDTVVVFDKVEENTEQLATSGRMTYQDSANLSLNQVFMRSLNTTLSTILPVAALLFVGAGLLGASTLKDLSLALFVGLLMGAYSSIYVAVPVLSVTKEHEPRYRNVREKVLRDARRSAALTPATTSGAALATSEGAEATPATSAARGTSASRPPARPRAGSKKSKRRKRR